MVVGVPILAAGGGTAVLGILHALMQNDVKRVLAYSTIEISAYLCRAWTGAGVRHEWMARRRCAGFDRGPVHVLNHALFKSILFFGAGAVLTATGERNMDRLGGLIHPMRSRVRVPRCVCRYLCAAAA